MSELVRQRVRRLDKGVKMIGKLIGNELDQKILQCGREREKEINKERELHNDREKQRGSSKVEVW